MVRARELPINTVREGTTATDMAEAIFGDGVTVTGATYYGDIDSAGIYTDGDRWSPGVTPSDSGVILSTGNAEDFTNSRGQFNQNTNTSTNTSGINNNPDFNAEAGTNTYDAAYLDVDFIPDGSVMTMQFVFSSEEYPEFQNSIYQDFVGVWINGQLVDVAVGDGDTDPGNINTTNNINMYVDNQSDDYNTEMDGFTITMTLTMNVNPDVVNSMRIAIADVGDSQIDSNLMIAGNSVQTRLTVPVQRPHHAAQAREMQTRCDAPECPGYPPRSRRPVPVARSASPAPSCPPDHPALAARAPTLPARPGFAAQLHPARPPAPCAIAGP